MAIKTILVAPVFESQVETIEPDHCLTQFATQIASLTGSHLNICLAVGRFHLPSTLMVPELKGLVQQANHERLTLARNFGDEILRRARSQGASASLQLLTGDHADIALQLAGLARTCDLALAEPAAQIFALRQTVVEELLFDTGRPVLLLPEKYNGKPDMERIVLAWDGSAKAARAIGDATPFIERAKEIEIVTIEGDPNHRKRIAGSDIAPCIARHARHVHLTNLNCPDGDIAHMLAEHVSMTRADLLVMGAYGHTRLRQFVLGGVTRTMTAHPPVPILMSY